MGLAVEVVGKVFALAWPMIGDMAKVEPSKPIEMKHVFFRQVIFLTKLKHIFVGVVLDF